MSATTLRSRRLAVIVALVTTAVLLAGCGANDALGLTEAPASLDPGSPTLTARDIAFSATELDVAAGTPFVLVFRNDDTVSHNVSIHRDGTTTDPVFEGVIVPGAGSTRWYPVPALAAGTYLFRCDLHPNMAGTLRAG
jgi:plastocyanin